MVPTRDRPLPFWPGQFKIRMFRLAETEGDAHDITRLQRSVLHKTGPGLANGRTILLQPANCGLAGQKCSLKDMNAGNWDQLKKNIRAGFKGKPPNVATTDFKALKSIIESSSDDIWITFHKAKMWWTRLAPKPIKEDGISKFRKTAIPWSDCAVNGRLLAINSISGKLSQIQGFRGTACRVKCIDILRRTLNGIQSPLAIAITEQRNCLAKHLTAAIKELHWKDFEILVDLVFRAAGLVRVSVLGQHAKGYDLELREPITEDRYVVR